MLQPHIIHQFRSAVWRLEIDPTSDTIFAEIREPDEKRASFASIDLSTGKLNFDDLQTEERWLTGIEAAYDSVLLLHNYQSAAGPVHKGIIAVDGLSGAVRWNNYVFAFSHLTINGPAVFDTRIQPPKLFLADIRTGATVRPYQPSIDVEPGNNIILPQVISTAEVTGFQLPVSAFGDAVHYFEYNNLRIVSLHTFAKGALQQHLYIMSGGEIIYDDLLNTDIQKLQPESFLIYKDQLICLKNKSQLKVLNL